MQSGYIIKAIDLIPILDDGKLLADAIFCKDIKIIESILDKHCPFRIPYYQCVYLDRDNEVYILFSQNDLYCNMDNDDNVTSFPQPGLKNLMKNGIEPKFKKDIDISDYI